jgi:tRNA-dihydrouridine synthase B
MKIGNLDLDGAVFMAPMAGITDPPFRRMIQHFGVSALWTEMISCDAVVRAHKILATMDIRDHRVPVIFQIVGRDPEMMAECARIIEDQGSASAVDINMGCPARQVVGSGGGVALMRDLGLAGRIISSVRNSISIPLTVKMRTGWDEKNNIAPELARVAENEGADAIIAHGRSKSGGHTGPVSLDLIGEVKYRLSIPVIGNGGVSNVEDAIRMVQKTGCDGVMVGKGALGSPWFPRKILEKMFGWTVGKFENSMSEIIAAHFEDQVRWDGILKGVQKMRKHLGWYSRAIPGAAEFRFQVFRENAPERVLAFIENFFGKVRIP